MEDGALGDGDANCSRFLLWREVEGGVSYSKRGEEIIFFGSLKRMMK